MYPSEGFEELPDSLKPEETGRYCEECASSGAFSDVDAYEAAIESWESVETWPATYKGRVRVHSSPKHKIVSDFFRDRDDALDQLKVGAMFLECNAIMEVKYNYEKRTSDNYTYKVWRATGIACKKSKS